MNSKVLWDHMRRTLTIELKGSRVFLDDKIFNVMFIGRMEGLKQCVVKAWWWGRVWSGNRKEIHHGWSVEWMPLVLTQTMLCRGASVNAE